MARFPYVEAGIAVKGRKTAFNLRTAALRASSSRDGSGVVKPK